MAEVDLLEIVLANWPNLLIPMPEMKGGDTPTAKSLIKRAAPAFKRFSRFRMVWSTTHEAEE